MLLSESASNLASTSYQPTLPHNPTQLLLTSLRTPITTLEALEELLLQVLTALDSIPHPFKRAPKSKIELRGDELLRLIPSIQHILLNVILPTWLPSLRDAGHEPLAKAFFCPASPVHTEGTKRAGSEKARGIHSHCKVIISSVPILLSHLPTLNSKEPGPAAMLAFSVESLEDIVSTYPLDLVHDIVFMDLDGDPIADGRRAQEWEDYVRSVCSVPGKVANALQGQRDIVATEQLDNGQYFTSVCVSTEKILFRISQKSRRDLLIQSLSHLLLKLMHLGLFPTRPPTLPSQASFFSSTLPSIYQRLHLANASTSPSDAATTQYAETWTTVVNSFPLTSQQTFFASLLGALDCQVGRDTLSPARVKIRGNMRVLRGLLGTLSNDRDGGAEEDLWSAVSAVLCGPGRTWDVGILRAVVWWIADPQDSSVNERALEKLLDAAVALWTDSDGIRHSLLSQHRYTTSLFLLVLASLPPASGIFNRLALSPPFISSISTYLGHPDVAVRRCGMLVAEVVAARCGKLLEFGGWEGNDNGLDWARAMREWRPDWTFEDGEEKAGEVVPEPPAAPTATTTIPRTALADSDDDSLQGYDSPDSSRTPSPTPSELDEIEKDPTLRVGRQEPVLRPVYLAQLVTLLRTGKDDDKNAVERMEVALSRAEALIRRKMGFGTELEENAVELAIGFAGLRDNYELDGFEEKRQGALNALVECCPRKTAMTLVEQFFTNQYSTAQRFSILTALALGARVLAQLPTPPPRVSGKDVAFPSKMLPPSLHQQYATEEEKEQARGGSGQVQQLVRGITGPSMLRSKAEVEDAVPEIVRERQLRIGRLGSTRSRVSEVEGTTAMARPTRVHDTFADVAAEHFIMPLVNHMWLHMRDAETRPARSSHAGTGLILGSTVLAQYLGTLAVLVHAARHAPAFLGVLAPAVLELAVALGNRRVERDGPGTDAVQDNGDGVVSREGTMLTAALEVLLIVLDACVDLDGGRTLALEQTTLLLASGELAGGVLGVVEAGGRVRGGGGSGEGRLGGAAAAVVLRVDGIVARWGRSMVAG